MADWQHQTGTWEYTRIAARADNMNQLDPKLKELGENGWEMVFGTEVQSGVLGNSWRWVHLFFKRPKIRPYCMPTEPSQ